MVVRRFRPARLEKKEPKVDSWVATLRSTMNRCVSLVWLKMKKSHPQSTKNRRRMNCLCSQTYERRRVVGKHGGIFSVGPLKVKGRELYTTTSLHLHIGSN